MKYLSYRFTLLIATTFFFSSFMAITCPTTGEITEFIFKRTYGNKPKNESVITSQGKTYLTTGIPKLFQNPEIEELHNFNIFVRVKENPASVEGTCVYDLWYEQSEIAQKRGLEHQPITMTLIPDLCPSAEEVIAFIRSKGNRPNVGEALGAWVVSSAAKYTSEKYHDFDRFIHANKNPAASQNGVCGYNVWYEQAKYASTRQWADAPALLVFSPGK